MMLLPGPGILQGMVVHVFHRINDQVNTDSDHENQQNQQRDSHIEHYSSPPACDYCTT